MKVLYLWKLYQAIIFLLCYSYTKSEVYTSVQHLRKAFLFERNMMNVLSNYVTKTEEKLSNIKRYLENYQQVEDWSEEKYETLKITDGNAKLDSDLDVDEKLAGNPLHVYQLMKRLTIDLKHLKKQDPTSDWKEVLKTMKKELDSNLANFEDETELKGAAQALVVLQSYYKLNATNLAEGNIAGIQTESKLTAFDCLYLGRYAYKNSMFSSAVLWYEQAYYLAGLENNKTLSQDVALRYLSKVYKEFYELEPPNNEALFFSGELDLLSEKLIELNKINFRLGETQTFVEAHRSFEALCRGEQFLSDKYIAKLKCFYDSRNSPYLLLMPAKVEQKHLQPEILIFYDVISDRMIEKLKAYAEPLLSRGQVVSNHDDPDLKTSRARVAKVTWMDTLLEGIDFKKLELNAEALTGLLTTKPLASELLQIGNYGTGGLYNPHPDYVIDFPPETGNRIATLMYYLSDVEKGGATAFPRLGVTLEPVKGAAAFWWNLKKSGFADINTFHGGCPVIIGSKWVANKWIKERAQFQTRPCGMNIIE